MDKKTERVLYLLIMVAVAAFGYYALWLPALKRRAELDLLESEAEITSSQAAIQTAQAKEVENKAILDKAERDGRAWFASIFNPRSISELRGFLWTKPPGKDHYYIHREDTIEHLNRNMAKRFVRVFKEKHLLDLPTGWKLEHDGRINPGKEVLTIPTPAGTVTIINPQINYPYPLQRGITP